MKKTLLAIAVLSVLSTNLYSQSTKEKITDVEKTGKKYWTWAVTQLIPSPTWINDRNETNSTVTFALRWQITAFNFSFNTNKYISPVQFIFVNPMRKYTGSLELFVQPELATGSFEYSKFNKTGIGVGSRINIPVKNMGEHLYVSLGGKYTFRKNNVTGESGYYGVEGGIYAVFGTLGLQFNYNFNNNTKYNIGIYFKYW